MCGQTCCVCACECPCLAVARVHVRCMCFWRQAEFPAPFPSFPAAPEKSLCRVLMSRCGTNHTRSLVLNPVLEVEWSLIFARAAGTAASTMAEVANAAASGVRAGMAGSSSATTARCREDQAIAGTSSTRPARVTTNPCWPSVEGGGHSSQVTQRSPRQWVCA